MLLAMDLRHLRYFQAVAEELSFSKASRRLHIAQPALSRAVKELEEMLGLELLARTRRFVALTPAGRVLLSETRLLLQRLDEAIRRVQRTAAGEEGELRLGYIGPPTQIFLGRIVKEFRRRYPRLTVILEERQEAALLFIEACEYSPGFYLVTPPAVEPFVKRYLDVAEGPSLLTQPPDTIRNSLPKYSKRLCGDVRVINVWND